MTAGEDPGRVDVGIEAGVATVTLRRPGKLNALTPEMLDPAPPDAEDEDSEEGEEGEPS